MATERAKKIRAIFIGVVVIKLVMFFLFMNGKFPLVDGGVVSAIAQDEEGKKKEEKANQEKKEEKEGGENKSAKEEKKAGGEKEVKEEGAPQPEADPKTPKEPAQNPMVVLEGLEQKRKMLLEKEEQLKLEGERLEGIKKEIDEKLEKLSYTYRQIEEGLEKLGKKETESERLKREAEDAKMDQLVKVFTSMKPKKAGEIVNNMDLEVAKRLFLKMKGDRAGEILSFVNSDKAALISEKLTEKKEMF